MTIQSDNALKLLVRILEDPATLEMGNWYVKTPCGTTACAAGHSALLMGWKPRLGPDERSSFGYAEDFNLPGRPGTRTAFSLGMEYLELEHDVAWLLFYNTPRLALVNILVRSIEGEEITDDLVMDEVRDAEEDLENFDYVVALLQPRFLTDEQLAKVRLAQSVKEIS